MMINPYAYNRQPDNYHLELCQSSNFWQRYKLSFKSALIPKYIENGNVLGEYLVPRGVRQVPLVILIHGMAARSVTPCKLMANTLVRKGFASLTLYLVFHQYRVSDSLREKYPRLSSEEWFESYQISVTDVRQAIDWAETRPEIDSNRVATIGISYGGFISTIAMGLDKRIKAGVLIVTAGNSEKITHDSLLLRLQYKLDRNKYRHNQDAYASYLDEVASKGFENAVPGKSSYLTDPMTFSSYLREKPLLMLNASFDEIIPKTATFDLWKSCGKPPIYWYPATHSTIWAWYPLMGRRIAGFLGNALVPDPCLPT